MILGLAGKSGSGKNLLAQYLAEKDFTHFDLDQWSHRLLDEEKDNLLKAFGAEILNADGRISRKKLASLVFSNPEKKEKLQNILYPVLEKKVQKELEQVDSAVLNGALLSESGLPEICHGVIWLKAPFITRLLRLRRRDYRTIAELIKRMRSQKALKPQLFFGRVDTEIIVNRGKPEKMFRQTDRYLDRLKDKGSDQ